MPRLIMKRVFFSLLFGGVLGRTALAQMDSSPLKGKAMEAATRYAGGVDKEKVMDFFQDQQFDEALGYLSPVLRADSDNLVVLNYAGYAYFMSENAGAATACYRRMLKVDSNSVTALHYLVTLLQNSDATEALAHAMRLAELQPNKAAWWRSAGELLGRNKMPDSAMSCLWRAYSLAPGDARTVAALGFQLIEGRQYRKADSILDWGLAKDSTNVSLLKLRVQSAYFGKDYYDAFGPGEQLLRMNEPAVNSLEWLALSYYNLKLYNDCIRVCEGMQDMGLDIEAVYYYESRAQSKMGAYVESDSLLRKALNKAISKTAEWYYDDLGDNFESQKEYRKAVAHYDTAFYLFRDPLALYTCGRICESELHDLARARAYYRRYLAVAKPETAEEKKVWKWVKRRWGK
jgi:tetratricopeptide (TPR) repeat protein